MIGQRLTSPKPNTHLNPVKYTTVTISYWYWLQHECINSLGIVYVSKKTKQDKQGLTWQNIFLEPWNWNQGLSLDWICLWTNSMFRQSGSSHSYFTMWNRTACNESPRHYRREVPHPSLILGFSSSTVWEYFCHIEICNYYHVNKHRANFSTVCNCW
jgi:hypothetical protein